MYNPMGYNKNIDKKTGEGPYLYPNIENPLGYNKNTDEKQGSG